MLHHAVNNQELKDSFKNLYLDEDVFGLLLLLAHLGLTHLDLHLWLILVLSV